MEIYKLSDEIPDKGLKKNTGHAKVAASPALIVTNLKQGVKNPNRVNVYIDDKYAFSLDVSQVVDYKLKVGRELTEEELAELKKASEFGKLYQRTLEWVLMRPRSVREVKDYLTRKLRNVLRGHFATNEERVSEAPPVTTGRRERVREEYSEFSEDMSEFSSQIINRLVEKGYVNDRKFADYYVENRFVKKGISRKRLKMELIKKGISREIVEEVLDGRNDEEEIDKIIAKKRAKYDDEKLISYLCRQGFSYQLAQSRVREYGKD